MPDDLPLPPEHAGLDFTCSVGLMQVMLELPGVRSLKAKRSILKRTKAHLCKHHEVSVAEVADHDVWGRAGLAVACVTGPGGVAEQTLQAVARTLKRDRDVVLIDYSIEIF